MKIAIVNPNSFETQSLIRLLREQRNGMLPQTTVCWFTHNGASALARCRLELPDVLLLALNLTGENGVEITRTLVAEWPTCRILVVSSSLARHATQAYAAVAAGAFDVVTLPAFPNPIHASNADLLAWQRATQPLLEKLSVVQKCLQLPESSKRASVTTETEAVTPLNQTARSLNQTVAPANQTVSSSTVSATPSPWPPLPWPPLPLPPLIVIGASTGGPKAIAQFLAPFPADFPAAFVIVQHVSARFATSLSDWLQQQTALKMTPIIAGTVPVAGQVAIAAEDRHLILRANRSFGYQEQSSELHYCPSINLFFETVAAHWSQPGIAIVLTGMGKDGATGMKQLRDRGWYTLAQDEATASIHSMPRAAIETGSVVQILTPREMAQVCLRKFTAV